MMVSKKSTGKTRATPKPHTKYKISGESVTRIGKLCPKCGAGVFLAEHKDRMSCGKCGYTEFSKKQ